tara:strand:+ start:606 stop:881 length:276 start_codon:yes stop_codon:yes gene_type:complete
MKVGDKVIIEDDKINSYHYKGNVAPLFERNEEIEFEIINIYKNKKFVDLKYKYFVEHKLTFKDNDNSAFFEQKQYNVFLVPIKFIKKTKGA